MISISSRGNNILASTSLGCGMDTVRHTSFLSSRHLHTKQRITGKVLKPSICAHLSLHADVVQVLEQTVQNHCIISHDTTNIEGEKMFTTNSSIHKMFHPRIPERSCQKCQGRIHGMNFHCAKCGEWYCLTCGSELRNCPKCGSKLE